MKQFNESNRDIISAVVNRLINSSQQPQSFRYGTDGLKYTWAMTIQDRLDFRCLMALAKEKIADADIMNAIGSMIDRSLNEAEHFDEALSTRLDEVKANQRISDWSILVPLSIKLDWDPVPPPTRRILGHTITLRSWHDVKDCFGSDTIEQALPRPRPKVQAMQDTTCVVVDVRENSERRAADEAESVFNTFRGALEFSIGFLRERMSWPPKPRRVTPPPRWFIVVNHAKNSAEDYRYTYAETDPECPQIPLSEKNVQDWFNNLSKIGEERAESGSLSEVVAKAWQLYIQAVDATHEHLAFLALWQFVELITQVGDHHGDGQKACSRLALLLQEAPIDQATVPIVLRELYKRRNEIVHAGNIGQVSQQDVNVFKACCEMGLKVIVEKLPFLKSRHALEHYYEWANFGDAKLSSIESATRYIRSARSRKK